jgi:hypothetical protein
MNITRIALLVGVMALVGTACSTANAEFFKTPSQNIACGIGDEAFGTYAVACTVFTEANAQGQKIWAMRARRGVRVFRSQSNAAFEVPILGYGRKITRAGVTCKSLMRGLRCRNRSGHGFLLARERQRVF